MPCADPPGDSPGEAASAPIEYAPVCSPSDDYVVHHKRHLGLLSMIYLAPSLPARLPTVTRFCNGLTPGNPPLECASHNGT